jgi:type I restriction enzyme S subunit
MITEKKIKELPIKIGDGNYSSKYPKSSEFLKSGIPFISASDLKNGRIVPGGFKFISKEQHNVLRKGHLLENDVLIVSRGNGVGQVSLVDKQFQGCNINAQLVLLRVDEKVIHSKYLYYLLSSKEYFNLIKEFCSGSAQPQLTITNINEITLKLPQYNIQVKIAEILSSLDDKIELNNKINKELESLAQMLFKRWFVDYEFPNDKGEPYKASGGEMVDSEQGVIPRGWKIGNIYDISNVIYGAPFKSSLFNQEEKGLPLIRIRDLKTYKPQNWTEEVHSKGTKICPGDLVVGMDAEFRPHFWLGQVGWLNQRVCQFKPNQKFSRLFIREVIRPQLAFFENSSVGTTVIHLGKGDIDTFKSIIPDNITSKLFTEITEPLIDKIVYNSQENNLLTNLRDTLLPKLISGELQIKDK